MLYYKGKIRDTRLKYTQEQFNNEVLHLVEIIKLYYNKPNISRLLLFSVYMHEVHKSIKKLCPLCVSILPYDYNLLHIQLPRKYMHIMYELDFYVAVKIKGAEK